MVLKGEIDLNTKTESFRLDPLDTFDIPLRLEHTVVAYEDAVFLVLLTPENGIFSHQ